MSGADDAGEGPDGPLTTGRSFAGSTFACDLLSGLSASPKALPCKYLYDFIGSALFERICELPEYYPTRAERAILSDLGKGMGDALPAGLVVIEPGSGSCEKIARLLPALHRPAAYVAIDVCAPPLTGAAADLRRAFCGMSIHTVVGDFHAPLRLPPTLPVGPRLVFFPGSTIGNCHPGDAVTLLRRFTSEFGAAYVLVGVDLKKDRRTLQAAYDDGRGVTAAFNLNLLARANRELGTDFKLSRFSHLATYNEIAGRIEMYLVSRERQTARVLGQQVLFGDGETIHTENCYKYTVDEFQQLASRADLTPIQCWTDPERLFSVHLLAANRSAHPPRRTSRHSTGNSSRV